MSLSDSTAAILASLPEDELERFIDELANLVVSTPVIEELTAARIGLAKIVSEQIEELERAAAIIEQLVKQGDEKPTRGVEDGIKESQQSLEKKAVAVLALYGGNLTKKELSEKIKCHVKSLSRRRCPQLDYAMKAFQTRDLPRGQKDKEGNLEAYDG